MSEKNGIEVWYTIRCGYDHCRRSASVSYISGKGLQTQARKHFVTLNWSKTKNGWRCPDHKRQIKKKGES